MMVPKMTRFLGLLFFVTLSVTADEGIGIIPVGKELVYDYLTIVQAGTLEPAHYNSEFMLRAKLHIQGGLNSSTVKLTDVKYKVHNGRDQYWKHNTAHTDPEKFLPIPDEASELTKVFQVQYDVDGKVLAIATESSDKMWSRNIKQAIASIFQLDLHEIDVSKPVPHAFYTHEETIYGQCDVACSVIPHEEKIIVHKVQNPHKCKHHYNHMWFNSVPAYCMEKYENPVSSDSNRIYTLIKKKGFVVIQDVIATGSIYVEPFKGHSEAHYLRANQTMKLLETNTISQEYTMTDQQWLRGLKYNVPDIESPSGAMQDLTGGREHVDVTKAVTKINEMMDEAVTNLEENHITAKTPDIKHQMVYNRMLVEMTFLDTASFEQMFAALHEKRDASQKDHQKYQVFMQLASQVGTKASVLFVRNLVRKQKVADTDAVAMLSALPYHIRVPCAKLVTELQDLLTVGDEQTHHHVRHAGILAFATIVYKTHEYIKHDSHDKAKEFVEPHITTYMNGLNAATDYKTKMIWMEGLHNIKVGTVVKQLEPIVKGVTDHGVDARYLAMWASMAEATKDPHYAFKVYWPILADRHAELELRTAAYTILMSVEPTMDRYLNMYWFMQTEKDHSLYHYHYTTLQSLAHTKHPCYQTMGLHAKHILRFTPKPKHHVWLSGNYLVDYIDPKYGYGGMVQTLLVNTKRSQTAFVQYTAQLMNMPFEYLAVYLKVTGLDAKVRNKIFKNKISSDTDFNQVIQDISAVNPNDKLHVEIIFMTQSQTVMSYYYDQSNLNDLFKVFDIFKTTKHEATTRMHKITYGLLGEKVMATDFGVPAYLSVRMPMINALKLHYNHEKSAANQLINVHVDASYRMMVHGTYGLEFYNPVSDMWHGIQKVHLFNTNMPINFDLVINPKQLGTYRFSWNKVDEKDVFGLQSYVETEVFLDGHDDVFKQHCPECKHFDVVTKGEQFRKHVVLHDHELYDLGVHYETHLFDCERPVSRGDAVNFLWRLLIPHTKNSIYLPVSQVFLAMRNWEAFALLSPPVGSCGYVTRMVPSTVKPVDHIDIAFRMGIENTDTGDIDENVLLPDVKVNTRITYSVKSAEAKVHRSWDVTYNWENHQGFIDNKDKLQVVRTIPGEKDFKILIDGHKKYINDGVDGKLKLTITDGEKETVFDVTMKGEMSEEQKQMGKDKLTTYDECINHDIDNSALLAHSMECNMEHTTLRKYTYDVKINDANSVYYKYVEWFKKMGYSLLWFHSSTDSAEKVVTGTDMKIEVIYPVHRDQIDVVVHTADNNYKFSGLSIDGVNMIEEFEPENLHYSQLFLWLQHIGAVKTCYADHHSIHKAHNEVLAYPVPATWTLYASDSVESPKYAVYVKKVEGRRPLALKVAKGTNVLEIVPVEGGNEFTMTLNGNPLSAVDKSYHYESWFSYKVLHDQHSILLSVYHYGLHIEYDGKSIKIDVPFKPGTSIVGKCFAEHQDA